MPPAVQRHRPLADEVQSVLASLERLGDRRIREQMEPRFGIVARDAFGVRMNDMQQLAKRLGRNHALALALWETGNYEARIMVAYLAEPERVTPAQMDRWCRDFDNWAVCDTLCLHLFDRVPHAFRKVAPWSRGRGEFVKRAAFALLAALALHDKRADDEFFARCLPLAERAASDGRNFVKKGVSWALRAIGRRSPGLHTTSVELAQRLAASPEISARWVGRDVLRDLAKHKARQDKA